MRDLYTPTDVNEAAARFNASCGPAALAAVQQKTVCDIMRAFPGWRGYCNPSTMKHAIGLVAGRDSFDEKPGTFWPLLGLGFVQFCGPWEQVSVAASYRRTHWVGLAFVDGQFYVYDVNAVTVDKSAAEKMIGQPFTLANVEKVMAATLIQGGWATRDQWEKDTLPQLLRTTKGATGWYMRQVLQVKRIAP